MAAGELPAEQLFPGDRIRQGFRMFVIERVAVCIGTPVRVGAFRLSNGKQAALAEDLTFAMGEIVRRVEP